MRAHLKDVVVWVGMGVSMMVYMHQNFASTNQVANHTERLQGVATRNDIKEIREDIRDLRKEIIDVIKDR